MKTEDLGRGTGLREMSAKWRATANVATHEGWPELAAAYDTCADELDAALSALPLEEGPTTMGLHELRMLRLAIEREIGRRGAVEDGRDVP